MRCILLLAISLSIVACDGTTNSGSTMTQDPLKTERGYGRAFQSFEDAIEDYRKKYDRWPDIDDLRKEYPNGIEYVLYPEGTIHVLSLDDVKVELVEDNGESAIYHNWILDLDHGEREFRAWW